MWARSRFGSLQLGEAPYTRPGPHELVVRNRAIAVNPIDALPPLLRTIVLPWLRYPAILGSDVAGEVVEVGRGVTRFRHGDRVLGHAAGIERSHNRPAEGAFQRYTVLMDRMTALVPPSTSLPSAAVLPVGLSTAATGLFQPDHLGLHVPGAPVSGGGRRVVVWGGSTSVGSNAVQLAVDAGYDVVTTASPHNAEYLKGLGASEVFTYRDQAVVDDILAALMGRELSGVLAIGRGATGPCVEIAHRADGSHRVATTTPGPQTAVLAYGARRHGVALTTIWGSTLMDNAVGAAIYGDFLSTALAEGRFVPAPNPRVVGHGLGQIPGALDTLRQRVSAAKVVVTL